MESREFYIDHTPRIRFTSNSQEPFTLGEGIVGGRPEKPASLYEDFEECNVYDTISTRSRFAGVALDITNFLRNQERNPIIYDVKYSDSASEFVSSDERTFLARIMDMHNTIVQLRSD